MHHPPDQANVRELNATLETRVDDTAADLDRVWHNASDMFVVIDGTGTFQRVNPAASAILGCSADELIGKAVFDFDHPNDVAPTLGALEHARGAALPAFENRYRAKDASFKHIAGLPHPKGK